MTRKLLDLSSLCLATALVSTTGCGPSPEQGSAGGAGSADDLVEQTIVTLKEDGTREISSVTISRARFLAQLEARRSPAQAATPAKAQGEIGVRRQAVTVKEDTCSFGAMVLYNQSGTRSVCFSGRGSVQLADYGWQYDALNFSAGSEAGTFSGMRQQPCSGPGCPMVPIADRSFDSYEFGMLPFSYPSRMVQTLTLSATVQPWLVAETATGNPAFTPDLASQVGTTQPRAALRVGDFLGAGINDVMMLSHWGSSYTVNISYDGRGWWNPSGTLPLPTSQILIGDFTGDGRSDIVYVAANGIHLQDLRNLTVPSDVVRNPTVVPFADLAAGDFVGDARADLFWADGTHWFVSDAGQGPFVQINTSSFRVANLAFQDLDSDGRTDVVRADGLWRISRGGTGAWETLQNSNVRLADLGFGNFVGDAKVDVVYVDGGNLMVSDGGTGVPYALPQTGLSMSNLLFGNFRGDAHTDILQVPAPITGP